MSENINHKQIQWFPGHMTKTLRSMEREVRGADVVLVLLDARIPRSSLNPEIERIAAGKPKLYILNKADLADPDITAQWVRHFTQTGNGCVAVNSKMNAGGAGVRRAIDAALKELLARRADRGMAGAQIRIMLAGIPNVGKSTFINGFAGSARVRAEDRPGVTRGKQWVTAGGYELLDMPGVLWKKFDSLETASNLALIGSIRDDVLDLEALAMSLADELRRVHPDRLAQRFGLTEEELALEPYELLEAVGRHRGMLMSGGVVNTERAARMLLDEFRGAKFGRISLERP